MGDLEDLWNDLPVHPAPIEAVLRTGRAIVDRPRRRARRVAAVGAVAATVAAAFVVGGLVSGGPGGTDSPGGVGGTGGATNDMEAVAFQGALQPAGSCRALLAHYQDAAVKLVSAYGWSGAGYSDDVARSTQDLSGLDAALPQRAAESRSGLSRGLGTTTTVGSQDSPTGTNVQEAGVDEPDVVKTSGRLLARIHDGTLTTYTITGSGTTSRVRAVGALDLPDITGGEILLSGTTITAIDAGATSTQVDTVDVADPAHPRVTDRARYTAGLDSARLTGDAVRLILHSGLPTLHFVEPQGSTRTEQQALDANQALVRHTTLADWTPSVVRAGKSTPLLDCDRVAIPQADLTLGTMSVVGFDAAAPTKPQTWGLAGRTTTTYASTGHLYLAAQGLVPGRATAQAPCCYDYRTLPSSGDGMTELYDFRLTGDAAQYAGAGSVAGIVSDRWSMDEVDGVLRVAVEPSSQTGPYTSIITLHEVDRHLVQLGRLDGLGRHQQMESVRWFGGLALLTTYHSSDPLYAVDLTDQARPHVIGRLHLGGYSTYLHPLGRWRVLGVGYGPHGARIGLFDTHRPQHLRLLGTASLGQHATVLAGADPRQFTWVKADRTAYTVLRRGTAGYLATVRVAGGAMTVTKQVVEHGRAVGDVRVVPLGTPGAPQALVTDEAVTLLPPADLR